MKKREKPFPASIGTLIGEPGPARATLSARLRAPASWLGRCTTTTACSLSSIRFTPTRQCCARNIPGRRSGRPMPDTTPAISASGTSNGPTNSPASAGNSRARCRLWQKSQARTTGSTSFSRAKLAITTHLKRIELRRPLHSIVDQRPRNEAEKTRIWFRKEFLNAGMD